MLIEKNTNRMVRHVSGKLKQLNTSTKRQLFSLNLRDLLKYEPSTLINGHGKSTLRTEIRWII